MFWATLGLSLQPVLGALDSITPSAKQQPVVLPRKISPQPETPRAQVEQVHGISGSSAAQAFTPAGSWRATSVLQVLGVGITPTGAIMATTVTIQPVFACTLNCLTDCRVSLAPAPPLRTQPPPPQVIERLDLHKGAWVRVPCAERYELLRRTLLCLTKVSR